MNALSKPLGLTWPCGPVRPFGIAKITAISRRFGTHPFRQKSLILLIFYRFFYCTHVRTYVLILIAGLCDRCAEKQKIVMAITEIPARWCTLIGQQPPPTCPSDFGKTAALPAQRSLPFAGIARQNYFAICDRQHIESIRGSLKQNHTFSFCRDRWGSYDDIRSISNHCLQRLHAYCRLHRSPFARRQRSSID